MRFLSLVIPLSVSLFAGTVLAEDEALTDDREEAPPDVTDQPPTSVAPKDSPAPVSSPAPTPPAASAPDPRAAETLDFADHLFLDGDWYRSITEYRRFLFQVKGRGSEAPRAALAIGEALLRGEQWDAAGRQLDGVAQRASALSLRRTALFGAGRAYLLDGRPELAKPRFRLLVDDEGTPSTLRQEAAWLLAWGHFDAGELEEAYRYFSAIAQAGGAHAQDAQGVAEALLDRDALETKDPVLAGALSLIPGLGHFYLGRWGVGLTSLVWNAVFIFATVQAWLTGQWGVAVVLTVFELGWYAGGVFGAVAGAYRHNRDAVRNWRDDILLRYGATRELPPMHVFDDEREALPGTLIRFGGTF